MSGSLPESAEASGWHRSSGHGLLSLVSVLGSQYPVVTVLLAHVVLGERLTRGQRAGVLVAFAGVAAIAAG